ncbi:uncharacterized protein LOC119464360 [Dermacentor silvarum]|uniref:uncharacterized protein LOC119464360 n=1 Tax=Dermacentor silvarum TaxID=543639 RepID=UPI00189C53C5|nr:uncharacterized protein LOC119464360 [Dermacentor silvarum]XP_049512140.1 uncharacterized protein LOC119464360 [Dermacentor silvarum]
MWQRRNQRPLATARGGRQTASSAVKGQCFEQQLAARHMMLHWLATQQASAAVDTGRPCTRPSKPVKQAACKAEVREQRHGKQASITAPAIAAKLSDLLGRCRPMGVAPTTEGRSSVAHLAQSRLAQMPWCYQGPLRHAEPSSPETIQHDQLDLEEEDEEVDLSGTLERGAPYLDFLARLTEHLVNQPDLSNEALHGVCEKYIAREAARLDQEILWNLVWELFPELYQWKHPLS